MFIFRCFKGTYVLFFQLFYSKSRCHYKNNETVEGILSRLYTLYKSVICNFAYFIFIYAHSMQINIHYCIITKDIK